MTEKNTYFLFTGVNNIMQQSHIFGTRGLGVGNPGQTGKLEAHSIASLASIHVISKGQDDFQHLS